MRRRRTRGGGASHTSRRQRRGKKEGIIGGFSLRYQKKRKRKVEKPLPFAHSIRVTQENIANFILQTRTIRSCVELIDTKISLPLKFQYFPSSHVPIAVHRVMALDCSLESAAKIQTKRSLSIVFQQMLLLAKQMTNQKPLEYQTLPKDQVILFQLDKLCVCKGVHYIPVSFENSICTYSLVVSVSQLKEKSWLISQWKVEYISELKFIKFLVRLCLLTQMRKSDVHLLCGYQQFILEYNFIWKITEMYTLAFPTLEEAKKRVVQNLA
jgi:hypothetical protein